MSLDYEVKNIINDIEKDLEKLKSVYEMLNSIKKVDYYVDAFFEADEFIEWVICVKLQFYSKNGKFTSFDLYKSHIDCKETPYEINKRVCKLAEEYECNNLFEPSEWIVESGANYNMPIWWKHN